MPTDDTKVLMGINLHESGQLIIVSAVSPAETAVWLMEVAEELMKKQTWQ